MSEPARGERSRRDGVRAVAPLAIAVLGFGISFGVLARAAGMGSIAPIVMSMTTFAGSAQFAAASILAVGGTVGSAVTAAVLLNTRYGPIGVTVAPSLHGSRWSRFLHAQLTVDETWAVAAEGEGRFNPGVLLGAGVTLYLAWVGGTILGVAFGDVIGDPSRWGLDAAFPALFLGLLWPQLRGRREVAAAVAGAGIALALTPITPPGVPIVAASAACLLGLGNGRARTEGGSS
jgi:4-azaleucine resistance transporter AzlC